MKASSWRWYLPRRWLFMSIWRLRQGSKISPRYKTTHMQTTTLQHVVVRCTCALWSPQYAGAQLRLGLWRGQLVSNCCGRAACWLISCELKLIRDAVIDEMINGGQGEWGLGRGLPWDQLGLTNGLWTQTRVYQLKQSLRYYPLYVFNVIVSKFYFNCCFKNQIVEFNQ